MINGCPHPMMMAAGGHWDSHYKVGHSVRLRPAATGNLSRVFGVSTNGKKWTLSIWLRKTGLSPAIAMPILGAYSGNSDSGFFDADFGPADSLRVSGYNTSWRTPAKVYRDPLAWPHLVISADTDNATAQNRLRIYDTGVEITAFSTNNAVALGQQFAVNAAGVTHYLGYNPGIGGATYLDGYIAEVRFIDGDALGPEHFGRVCPDKGHWEPINYAGAYGNNGFYLDFSDSSAATSAALGKDRSGNNNDWTPNGVSVAAGASCDWMMESPTNRHCTLNSLAYRYGANHSTETDGLLTCAGSQPGAATYSYGSIQFSTGKFVAEAIVGNASGSFMLGVCNPGDDSQLAAYINSGQKVVGGTVSAYGAAFTTGDVIAIEADADAKTIEFFKQTGGAGSFVSQGLFSIASLKFPLVFHCQMDNTAKFHWTFGQRAMGHTASAGFKTLCAANEPEPAIARRRSAFVAVADSGANIAATLASARAGWADYIEIFKRLDATPEGWRWRFASDPGNYLDSSSTAEKAAFPALAGTSYVGYALKVSAQNGVATGTFAHVNGVADTINDGLGTARKAIILRRESVGGGDWALYHPDLTAGKLLFLNLGDAEATNATISGVTSNAFVAAAALSSGTYRWISIAELSGLIRLGRHVGNYSTDGPMDSSDHSPALVLIKNKSRSACTWILHDSVRSPFNPSNNTIYPNNNSQENASLNETIDMLSSGFKLRNISSDINYTAPDEYVYLSIGQSSRYANAR
ncbi:MAG: hypothetical protein Q7U97_02410 [Rhodocyclaceae bacterium]|nr:hypothetical protein [Rhodocyclaceae bacterium]